MYDMNLLLRRHVDREIFRQRQFVPMVVEYLPEGQIFGPWPDGNRRVLPVDAPEDPSRRYEVVNQRDLAVRERSVTVNYPMEIRLDSDVGHTAFNGVTRQIPVRRMRLSLSLSLSLFQRFGA